MNIGNNLKNERIKKNLSQGNLSKKSGVSVPNISRYEADIMIPSVVNAKQLADALEISLETLLK